MSQKNAAKAKTSRRGFLAASGAAVIASGIKLSPARAQAGTPFLRKSLAGPQIGPVLDSYRKAIAAMLQLPPTDARNWYRIAFIHELDCPHQNWWFLPWHRGYIGWFEQICRDLSGDSTFALPYWDWTANPNLPAPFGDNSVLNPANPAFIASLQDFQSQMSSPVSVLLSEFYPGSVGTGSSPSTRRCADLLEPDQWRFLPDRPVTSVRLRRKLPGRGLDRSNRKCARPDGLRRFRELAGCES